MLYSVNGFAQSTETHLISRFTQNEGLSSYNVHNIVQDAMGFTWIATQDGLSLFDGRTFTKYTNNGEKSKRISGTDVRCVIADSLRKILWVLTSYGDLDVVNYRTGEVIKTIKGKSASNDDWCASMLLENNRLWIGSMNGIKIFNILTNSWESGPKIPFTKNHHDDLFSVMTILVDAKGNIWAFTNRYGVFVINSKSKTVIRIFRNSEIAPGNAESDLNFTSAININDHEILAGTSLGLKFFEYDNGNIKTSAHFSAALMPLKSGKTGALAKLAGTVFIANSSGLYKLNDSLSSCVKIEESNTSGNESWLTDVHQLYIDDKNNVWLGCKRGLAFLSANQSPFKNFGNKTYNKSGLTHVYNLFPQTGGTIVGQENSLIRYDVKADNFTLINNSKSFNYAFTDFKNRTIVSADDGLYILDNNKLIPAAVIYPELKSIADCYINSDISIGDSLSIIGSDNNRGIFLWNYKRKILKIINNVSYPVKLRSNIVNRIFKDSKSRIWVLSDFGIDIISNDFSKVNYINIKNPLDNNPLKLYFDICEVGKTFWITSYSNGIAEVDANGKALKVLNTNNGLCDDGVYKIFKTNNKRLIITTNNGLSVFNTENSTFTNYYERDGLHSNAFEENCGTEKDGKIYAGGLDGFTIIDPKLLFINKTPPRLYFNNIKIDTKSSSINIKDLKINNLIVPDDVLQTTISFSGLNYTNPNRVTFKYKIEELNSKWIALGTQNFVNIIGLSPGSYNLLVTALNENGVPAAKPLKLSLLFLPKWYQTWWFKIVLLTAFCGVFYGVYAYRIKQFKIQQQIRRDIASDLHDDLGSSLNSIKIFTHLAIEKKQNATYLNEIEKLITHTAVGLRDMLWVLEDSKDDITGLMERIKKFAVPVAGAKEIRFESEINPVLANQNISKTEKRNLLLISKEALNNSFKYAACKNISVKFKQNDSYKVLLTIADDGAGFDTADKPAGYGLNNMGHRAAQINYELKIVSGTGNGTTITVGKK